MKEELGRTESCIPFDRLAEGLTAAEREHLAGCSRCEAELALAREFEAPAVDAGDADAVASIVARLQPQKQRKVVSIGEHRKRTAGTPLLALAAMLLLAVGISWLVQSREPGIDGLTGIDQPYRSSRVGVLAPTGDVAVPPAELRWQPVAGATDYEAVLREVDGTTLWSASTRDTTIAVPRPVSSQFLPHKTVVWQVQARKDGKVLADSGVVKFRVVPQ